MIDLINSKLIAFKQRYANLKEQAITGFKDSLNQAASNESEPAAKKKVPKKK